MKKLVFLIIVAISIVILPSCGGSSKTTKINRADDADTATNEELSGDWSEVDARKTAEILIKQMLGEAWYSEALTQLGKKPMVLVGKVKNRSNEHINTQVFIKQIQRALILSRKVRFASDKARKLRQEKEGQITNATDDTAKSMGKELGADYMIFGEINTITDRRGGKTIKYYQVNLELHNIETGEIVWIGEKKIKKFIQQESRKW